MAINQQLYCVSNSSYNGMSGCPLIYVDTHGKEMVAGTLLGSAALYFH